MVKPKTPAAPAPDTPLAAAVAARPAPGNDAWHGIGGSYVIGADGVRRQAEAPTAPAKPEKE